MEKEQITPAAYIVRKESNFVLDRQNPHNPYEENVHVNKPFGIP